MFLKKRIIATAAVIAMAEVTDIALECGFSSVSYFIKQFKGVVGCTPAAYRKQGSTEL